MTITVGANGCDYTDVQSAIDNCNDSETNHVTIEIKNGIYSRFTMRNGGTRLRYISLIGETENSVIVRDTTGNYDTPPAEIFTNGFIKNITFEMETDSDNFVNGGAHNYAYAVHTDFGTCDTQYEDCTFKSNAGPAVGAGLYEDEKLVFKHCKFISTSDGTFGRNDLGAFYCHANPTDGTMGQYAEIDSCLCVNENGNPAFYFDHLDKNNSEYTALVMNTMSRSANGRGYSTFRGNFLNRDSYNNIIGY